MHSIFLIISAILTVAAVVPYILDIRKGLTKPNLVSWITWTLLTGIATAAQISAGELVAATFSGSAVLGTALVVIFGLRHGYVKYARFDVVCQIAAVVGIILWQLFDSPAIGVIAAVTIDFIGALPTIRHAWNKPGEETWQTFGIAGVGGIFGIAALTTFNLVTLPYAIYIILINFSFVAIILKQRKR